METQNQNFSTPTPSSTPIPPPPSPGQIDLSGNKGMAILAYLGILIVVPFFTGAKKDPFVKFHLKQGLGLFIVWIVAGVLSSMLSFMLATIGGIAFLVAFLFPLIYLGLLIINIIGLINAATGKMNQLPLIGSVGNMFNF